MLRSHGTWQLEAQSNFQRTVAVVDGDGSCSSSDFPRSRYQGGLYMQGISGGILAKNKEIKKKQCYQAQVQLPTAQESNAKRQVLAKEKIALLRKLANLGRRWTHVPKNQIPKPRFCSEIIQKKRQRVYMLRRGFWMHNQLVDILLWLVVRSQEINIINLLTGQGFMCLWSVYN